MKVGVLQFFIRPERRVALESALAHAQELLDAERARPGDSIVTFSVGFPLRPRR